jgi:DNA-binding TFAR19-related protein (PDSD5 family)
MKKERDEDLQDKISWFRHITKMLGNFEAFVKFYQRLEQESHRKFVLMNTLTMEKRDRLNLLHVVDF